MLLSRWKSLLADTWRQLVEAAPLTRTQDLFCWRCGSVRATRVSRFTQLRNIQAKGRHLLCPVCGDRLLWAHDMRRIRAGKQVGGAT